MERIHRTEAKESNIKFIVVLLILINWDSDEQVEDDVNKYSNRLEFERVEVSANMIRWFNIFNKSRPVLEGILLHFASLNGIAAIARESAIFDTIAAVCSIHSFIH